MESFNLSIAEWLVRVFLGILFFFQGYDKIFRLRIGGEMSALRELFSGARLPDGIIRTAAYFTSYAELIGGISLIAGIFVNYACYLLCIDLLIVALGFSITRPMWDLQHVFPRLAMLVFILLTHEAGRFSMDYLIR